MPVCCGDPPDSTVGAGLDSAACARVRTAVVKLCYATALAAPGGNAFALSRTQRSDETDSGRIVKTVNVDGPIVPCPQPNNGFYARRGAWGMMKVELTVVKNETVTGSQRSVSIKITGVSWPIYPDHTPKTKYINSQALPLLQQETLRLNANAPGASRTSGARPRRRGAGRPLSKPPPASQEALAAQTRRWWLGVTRRCVGRGSRCCRAAC